MKHQFFLLFVVGVPVKNAIVLKEESIEILRMFCLIKI